jgi:amino acid transporter
MKTTVAGKLIEEQSIAAEKSKLKRELTLLPLFGLIYFTVCGGSFGAEPMVGWSGPGLAILLLILTPLFFSIPNMLMVREMQSMMPVEGGYYHWLKKAFGPFTGFMGGWMNWVVSWVDVSIYPVLAAYYLGYFIPALRTGATIGGVFISSTWLSFLVAVILIWGISLLTVRGARLAGLTTNWIGLVMLLPLIVMSLMGLYVWLRDGTVQAMPFLPGGEPVTFDGLMGALSTGIFVAMWNFMGWELPTAAGDEIVNPKRTYPIAMVLVLFAAIATYAIPTITGLYGGAGDYDRYQLWGIEEYESGQGIGAVLEDYGVPPEQVQSWGIDTTSSVGWEFPDIAHAIADRLTGQTGGGLAQTMGALVTFAAVLSMIGLFIGNGLGGTRVPFAMAEDGMMPKFLVGVHPRYGTPWVSILVCALVYTVFSLSAFAALVVIDVFLNMLVLMAEFFAMWKLRFTMPDLQRNKVPGGWFGLVLVTLAPALIILLAIYSQYVEEGMASISWALIAMAIGAVLYFPIRKYVKPGVPDVDPFAAAEGDD